MAEKAEVLILAKMRDEASQKMTNLGNTMEKSKFQQERLIGI